jgi:hypothetical protein
MLGMSLLAIMVVYAPWIPDYATAHTSASASEPDEFIIHGREFHKGQSNKTGFKTTRAARQAARHAKRKAWIRRT